MEPELVADFDCVTGENPLWHPGEQRLYWIDIGTCRLFRYDPADGHAEQVYQAPEAIGGFTVQADGALLLFMAHGAIHTWREGAVTVIRDELPEARDSRFNDVQADPEGRVFAGVMPSQDHPGMLYRLDRDGTLTKLLDGLGIPNGMGFTPDLRQLYFTDSTSRTIYLFDYDRASGALRHQRVFVQLPRDSPEQPDGLTTDTAGGVWSARWDGSALYRFAPDGTVAARVGFPARKVSCPAFGGRDYTDLYVTTAGGNHKATEGQGAGALFRLRPGLRGMADFPSRVGI
ncbi:MAG TPA: SMP-30/gluconolactonase/LRE family protein [Nitrolancea sp.]|nr:SMP-30/gluconolactonase/LRE family protein [Nitrolancea sp.]